MCEGGELKSFGGGGEPHLMTFSNSSLTLPGRENKRRKRIDEIDPASGYKKGLKNPPG